MKRYIAGEGGIKLRGRVYQIGRVIDNAERLSNLEYLISSGKITVEEMPDSQPVKTATQSVKKGGDPNLLDLDVADLTNAVASISDPDVIQSLIDAEDAGKTRKSAIKVLKNRLTEILESNG